MDQRKSTTASEYALHEEDLGTIPKHSWGSSLCASLHQAQHKLKATKILV